LINVLAKSIIAKTSKTPGRTQCVNFYDFDTHRLVDLPGYGYANVDKNTKNTINKMVNEYLVNRVNLYGVLQICDANVITKDDVEMSKFLQKKFKKHYIILNKVDKQNISVYKNKLNQIAKYLHQSTEHIFLTSVKKFININQIQSLIYHILKINK
jgi:GTP-binding protein